MSKSFKYTRPKLPENIKRKSSSHDNFSVLKSANNLLKNVNKLLDDVNINDYDIINIDLHIKNKLIDEKTNISILYEKLKNLEWISQNGIHASDKILARAEMFVLRNKIIDLERGSVLLFYILRTQNFIAKYKILEEIVNPRSFIKKEVDTNLVNEKNELVFMFLRIAREYINIKQYTYGSRKFTCTADCSSTEFESIGESTYVCKKCSNIIYCIEEGASYKDSDRVNMTNRYKYSCEGHFIETMDSFEGCHNSEMIDKTKEFVLKELKLVSGSELIRENITKDSIQMILSENKMSDNYKDVNLLHFLITGKPCPNISQFREELLDMHRYVEEASSALKEQDTEMERTNSINVNFKLYKLLQIVEYPCNNSDFYFLKTREKQREHEEMWKKYIEFLYSKYPNAITSRGKQRWRYIRT